MDSSSNENEDQISDKNNRLIALNGEHLNNCDTRMKLHTVDGRDAAKCDNNGDDEDEEGVIKEDVSLTPPSLTPPHLPISRSDVAEVDQAQSANQASKGYFKFSRSLKAKKMLYHTRFNNKYTSYDRFYTVASECGPKTSKVIIENDFSGRFYSEKVCVAEDKPENKVDPEIANAEKKLSELEKKLDKNEIKVPTLKKANDKNIIKFKKREDMKIEFMEEVEMKPFDLFAFNNRDNCSDFIRKSFVSFTEVAPSIAFCENPQYCKKKNIYQKWDDILKVIPFERLKIIQQFLDNTKSKKYIDVDGKLDTTLEVAYRPQWYSCFSIWNSGFKAKDNELAIFAVQRKPVAEKAGLFDGNGQFDGSGSNSEEATLKGDKNEAIFVSTDKTDTCFFENLLHLTKNVEYNNVAKNDAIFEIGNYRQFCLKTQPEKDNKSTNENETETGIKVMIADKQKRINSSSDDKSVTTTASSHSGTVHYYEEIKSRDCESGRDDEIDNETARSQDKISSQNTTTAIVPATVTIAVAEATHASATTAADDLNNDVDIEIHCCGGKLDLISNAKQLSTNIVNDGWDIESCSDGNINMNLDTNNLLKLPDFTTYSPSKVTMSSSSSSSSSPLPLLSLLDSHLPVTVTTKSKADPKLPRTPSYSPLKNSSETQIIDQLALLKETTDQNVKDPENLLINKTNEKAYRHFKAVSDKQCDKSIKDTIKSSKNPYKNDVRSSESPLAREKSKKHSRSRTKSRSRSRSRSRSQSRSRSRSKSKVRKSRGRRSKSRFEKDHTSRQTSNRSFTRDERGRSSNRNRRSVTKSRDSRDRRVHNKERDFDKNKNREKDRVKDRDRDVRKRSRERNNGNRERERGISRKRSYSRSRSRSRSRSGGHSRKRYAKSRSKTRSPNRSGRYEAYGRYRKVAASGSGDGCQVVNESVHFKSNNSDQNQKQKQRNIVTNDTGNAAWKKFRSNSDWNENACTYNYCNAEPETGLQKGSLYYYDENNEYGNYGDETNDYYDVTFDRYKQHEVNSVSMYENLPNAPIPGNLATSADFITKRQCSSLTMQPPYSLQTPQHSLPPPQIAHSIQLPPPAILATVNSSGQKNTLPLYPGTMTSQANLKHNNQSSVLTEPLTPAANTVGALSAIPSKTMSLQMSPIAMPVSGSTTTSMSIPMSMPLLPMMMTTAATFNEPVDPPKRQSLDDRIHRELNKMNSSINSQIVQIGNILQIVPLSSTNSDSSTTSNGLVHHVAIEEIMKEKKAEKLKRKQEREEKRKQKAEKIRIREIERKMRMKMRTEMIFKKLSLLETDATDDDDDDETRESSNDEDNILGQEEDADFEELIKNPLKSNCNNEENLSEADKDRGEEDEEDEEEEDEEDEEEEMLETDDGTIVEHNLTTKMPLKGILSSANKKDVANGENSADDNSLNANSSCKNSSKSVMFADGVKPGESSSPISGSEFQSPPPSSSTASTSPNDEDDFEIDTVALLTDSFEKYSTNKKNRRAKKKKLKVKSKIKKEQLQQQQQQQQQQEQRSQIDSSDSEDNLPPPSPPPGSPPPSIWPYPKNQHLFEAIQNMASHPNGGAVTVGPPPIPVPSLSAVPLPPSTLLLHSSLPPPLPNQPFCSTSNSAAVSLNQHCNNAVASSNPPNSFSSNFGRSNFFSPKNQHQQHQQHHHHFNNANIDKRRNLAHKIRYSKKFIKTYQPSAKRDPAISSDAPFSVSN